MSREMDVMMWLPCGVLVTLGDLGSIGNHRENGATIYKIAGIMVLAVLKAVLTRKNTITGIKYKDDVAIFAWELTKEPHCMPDPSGDTLEAIRHFSDFGSKVAELYPEYNVPRFPRDTQPELLRAENAAKKLMDLGLKFIPVDLLLSV